MRRPKINQEIKSQKVRLISEKGENLGIFSLKEALKYSQDRNLDLIEVSKEGEISVCRAQELGKYLYKMEKREKARRRKQERGKIKGMRISFRISDHDLEIKKNQIKKFLGKGQRVKIELSLKGREKIFFNLAKEKLEKFLEKIESEIKIKREGEIKKIPKGMEIIISKK